MGSFTFKWEHPADEVYVTGTFDNWTKTIKLDKEDNVFQKSVELQDASEKIYYKFVVDGNWVVNESAPKEPDHEGNVNNFLTPDQTTPTVAVINSVTPASTTAAMAAEVETKVQDDKVVETLAETKPVEEKPVETPAEKAPVEVENKAVEAASEKAPAEVENKAVEAASEPTVEPKETPSDIPGGFPITPATELEKPVGISPLPAAEGAQNPLQLQPGEKIPEPIKAQDINENVRLDKESYENGSAITGVETGLPPVSNNMIPESSLPIAGVQDVTLNSVTPFSTTAALAAVVPLEKEVEVPEVKKAENEPKVEEPKETAPADGDLAAIAATDGGAVIAASIDPKEEVKADVAALVDNAPTVIIEPAEELAPEVPVEVKESIIEAGKSPEAAVNTEAVEEKKAVEAELLSEVNPVPAETETKPEEVKVEETKPEEAKVEEIKVEKVEEANPKETNPKEANIEETKVEKVEETKPEDSKTDMAQVEAKPETKADVPVANTENGTTATENGTKAAENGSKPSEAAANDSTSKEAKKKHRISTLINKIKAKFN